MPEESIISISTGEPAGIGPDISMLMAQHKLPGKPLFIGNLDMLEERASCRGTKISIKKLASARDTKLHEPGVMQLIDMPIKNKVVPGTLNKNNADYVLNIIRECINLCKTGTVDAMVTAPIQKSILTNSSQLFTGHTEFISNQLNEKPLMMLASQEMRIALLTTHIPLSQVHKEITKDKIIQSVNILNNALIKFFKVGKPKINILSLNPHAGESGTIGGEEKNIIIPAIDELKHQGLSIFGPTPADTAFTNKKDDYDAYLSMYHDQALPVLKTIAFNEIINITLGLSIVRTSVDHGTALDIVCTNKVQEDSLIQAYLTAINMVAKC